MDNAMPNPAKRSIAFPKPDEDDMAEKNIIFDAWAEPNEHGHGFVGLYRAPGIKPGLIRDPATKRVISFSTEEQARLAAVDRLFQVLNTPRLQAQKHQGKQEKYKRMTGPEFAEKLQQSGITLTLLTYIYGTSNQRALQWLDGRNEKGQEELPPHPVRVLLELFIADPRNVDIAQRITDEVTVSRRG